MLKVATVCTGIGSPEMALRNLGIPHEIVFGCEIDKYAIQTYLANFTPGFMVPDMTKESWEGEKFYSDLFIGGIPCQAFSLAGKRLGELDQRGLLFFDFYRYVKNQKPKYFIIENVKGLLSDNDGATFQNWINLLGQSVNGNPFMFPHEDSLMYNLHWQVLNTKDYGLPQNRERVFLIGIKNDLPNTFVFPKGIPLKLRLKDILEPEVDEKYYLSEKMLTMLTMHSERHKEKGTGFSVEYKGENDIANCLRANAALCPTDNILKVENVGNTNPSGNGMNGNVFSDEGLCPTLTTNKGEGIKIQISSATKSGYEIATEGDSINLEHPNSETRRGRVGKQVAQTLTTSCNQGVMVAEYTVIAVHPLSKKLEFDGFKDGNSPALLATDYKAPKCVQYSDYRIRKLTPLEVFRLQGFPDEFLQNAIDAGVSNSQLYRQAGNSISVPVIQAILKNLLTSNPPQ